MAMEKRDCLLTGLLLALLLHVAASKDCPAQWNGFGESCYLLTVPTLQVPARSWEESRAICLGYGGDLVSIGNSSEVDFIYRQTKTLPIIHKFWIGLYRNKTTSNPKEGWVWSDGTNFSNPQQWHYGEPNNYANNEKCTELLSTSKKWNDNDCKKKFGSICKRRKGLPDPTISTSGPLPTTKDPPPTCDYGWEAYNRSCYKFQKGDFSWDRAKKGCRDTGGHLVKIDDVGEQAYLTYKVGPSGRNFWIGLNDLEVAGRWVWEYHTKDLLVFKNWQSGEPNGLGTERCVEMYGNFQAGFWNDASCSGGKGYICEKEEGKNVCPENWIPYNDTCYQFNLGSTQRLSWAAAKNACRSIDGFSSLVTITSQDEQDFVKNQVQASSQSEVWIGLSDLKIENIFQWSDGQLLKDQFSIWANGKPTENQDNKDCVMLLGIRTDGAWTVQSCFLRRNFVCMRKRDTSFCNVPLGMENKNIPDSQITATSSLSLSSNSPAEARLRHSSAWCPARNDKNPYLQIDLGSLYGIRKIVLEGNVTSFKLRYGKNGKQFKQYSWSSLKSPATLSSVTARFVRIYPMAWNDYPCLRLELIGCPAQG